MRSCLVAVTVAALSAATGSGADAQTQRSVTERLRGTSVVDLISRFGAPTATVQVSKTQRVFEWTKVRRGVGVLAPLGNSLVTLPPNDAVCTLRVIASSPKGADDLTRTLVDTATIDGPC